MTAGTTRPGQKRILAFAVAIALALVLLAVQCIFPGAHLAYAQIIPLLLLRRLFGFRTALILAVLAAPVLVVVDLLLRLGAGPFAFILQHSVAIGTALVQPGGDVAAVTPAGFDPLEVLLRPGSAQLDAVFESVLLAAVFVASLAVVERYESRLVSDHERERLSRKERRTNGRTRDLAAIAEAVPQLVWTYGTDGAGEYFNSSWTEYTGLELAVLHARGIEAALHPDDVDRIRNGRLASGASTRFVEVDVRLRARDGTYAWFSARATPLFNDDGDTILRWFGTYTDLAGGAPALASGPLAGDAHAPAASLAVALPPALPQVAGLRFDAFDRAGQPGPAGGSDWYEAFALLDGRIVLAVGGVAATGLAAAAATAAVRRSIRGAASLYADPLAILEAADRSLRVAEPGLSATAFVAVFDPIDGSLDFANAGHSAPLLRTPDGAVRELAAPGLPLGQWRRAESEGAATAIVPESLLVLYAAGGSATDDGAPGEGRLVAALADGGIAHDEAPAQALAGAVLRASASASVTILSASFEPPEASESVVRGSYEARNLADLQEIRARFGAAFASAGLSLKERGDAETILAELLANVVRHAPGPCEVVFDVSGSLPVLAVLDRGRRPLVYAGHLPGDAYARFGRGLFIVRALSVDLCASPRVGGGTRVRAVLQVESTFVRRPDCMDIASTLRTS